MKFKELREATLSKTQIKKVHDKADDLPKNDFIKRYGKEGDSVRFATATKMVKKELGIEDYEEGFKSDAQRRAAFASGYKEKGKKKDEAIKGNDFVGVSSSSIEYKQGKQAAKDGKKYDDNPYKSGNREMNIKRLNWSSGHNNFREELDDKDKETIKPIIKQLQKSVKAHDKQAKQLQKDIQDEVELTEGRVMIAVDKKTRKKWQFSDGMIVKHNGKQYKTEGVTTQQVLELTASFGTLKLGKKDIEAGFAKGIFSVVDDGSVYQPWKNDFEPEGEKELTEVHFSNRNEPPAAKGMHKLRSGRDIPSTSKVDAIHKKVVAMTDRNDHSGARIEIAKACGDKQLVQIFSALELIHDKYSGAVGNQSIELRGKMMNPLNKAIEKKFGKYADVIQDAL
jgi:hypothetical protein